jgi:hypothetical protein
LKSVGSGTTSRLYAAGDFYHTDTGYSGSIAYWDGASWTGFGGPDALIYAVEVADLGGGTNVFAGGSFSTDGTQIVNAIARWDGTNWWPLQTGMGGAVNALAAFDDGGGTALYAGGAFNIAGSMTNAHNIARWNGSTWSLLGTGLGNHVYALAVFDDGSGSALYVGGAFTTAGGASAKGVARWNGSTWTAVGDGFDNGTVFSLAVFDDGGGPALYAGGGFTSSGSVPMHGVAKWDGTTWSALGAGMNLSTDTIVRALASLDRGPGNGADIFAGGLFTTAGANPSVHIAEWRGCAGAVETFCFGDGTVANCPCRNNGQPEHGCENSASTGGARLSATGTTVPDRIVLHSSGEIASALSIFLQGDALVSSGSKFGDGLLCAGGHLERLFVEGAMSGATQAPEPGDPSITARSAALGDPIAPGSTRYYQSYYRDPDLAFCPAPMGDAWNVTNGVRIVW